VRPLCPSPNCGSGYARLCDYSFTTSRITAVLGLGGSEADGQEVRVSLGPSGEGGTELPTSEEDTAEAKRDSQTYEQRHLIPVGETLSESPELEAKPA